MDVPTVAVLITGLVSVLFVSVSADTRETRVESAPAGNIKVFVTEAEWGCPYTF